MLLYSTMWTVIIVLTYNLLLASSTITIWTSGQWNIIIKLYIVVMVTFFHSSLSTFENCGVIWGILLFYEDRAITFETSSLLIASSTFNITPSGLWTRSSMLHIGVMAAY
jgi:hypothetical protein